MKVLLWICSFLFGLGYDLIWGLHFPICSMLFKKESGTFLALLSLAMAFTNVLTNMVAPLLHQYGGFALHIAISFASLLIASILYVRVLKEMRIDAGVENSIDIAVKVSNS